MCFCWAMFEKGCEVGTKQLVAKNFCFLLFFFGGGGGGGVLFHIFHTSHVCQHVCETVANPCLF